MYKTRLTLGLCLTWELVCLLVAGTWIEGLTPSEFLLDGRVIWVKEGLDLSYYVDFPEYNYDVVLDRIGVVAEGSPED